MKLPKLANWLSKGDLEKYQQEAQQASTAQAKLQRMESEQQRLQNKLQETEKELEQTKAQLQINQGFQIELGETQLRLQRANAEINRQQKELFEQQKQINLLKSQFNQAKQSLNRSQNWTQYLQTPIQVVDIKKTLPKEEFDTLWGFGITSPNVKFVSHTGALSVKGWVLGKKAQVQTLRVVHQTEQLLTTSVKSRRPKIAEQYPDIPMASSSGFEFSLSVVGIPSTIELNLEAILADETIVSLCAITIQPQETESKGT